MPWLVRVVLGTDYVPATDAARILLLAACLRLVLGWTKSFPVSIGKPGLRIVAHGVEIVVLLPLCSCFGPLGRDGRSRRDARRHGRLRCHLGRPPAPGCAVSTAVGGSPSEMLAP